MPFYPATRSACRTSFMIARKWKINVNYHLEYKTLNEEAYVSPDKVHWIQQQGTLTYIIDGKDNKFLLSGTAADIKSGNAVKNIIKYNQCN